VYWLDVLVFLFGLFWGSFLALLSFRIPKQISIVTPRSFCDHCNKKIPFYYNIPLLSYILLKGKCKECGGKISWRYPLIELLTGAIFLFAFMTFAEDYYYVLIRTFILTTILLPTIFIDIDERIIPDRFSLGLLVAGFLLSFVDPGMAWHESAVGIVVGGGLFFIVAEGYHLMTGREGMGGGDIKLIAGIGAFMGWYPVLMVIFISSILGSIYGIFAMVVFKKGRLTEIPFGPFISIAALIYFLLFEGGFIK
jgi:leader peptidase (prepilin peptidase) / N-methyltransferase